MAALSAVCEFAGQISLRKDLMSGFFAAWQPDRFALAAIFALRAHAA
jgi:hypothetical protein